MVIVIELIRKLYEFVFVINVQDMMSAEPVLLALSVSSITVYYEDSHVSVLICRVFCVCLTSDKNNLRMLCVFMCRVHFFAIL
jgi:hypothetical protein